MPLSQIRDAWQRPTKTSAVARSVQLPMDIRWLVHIDDNVSAPYTGALQSHHACEWWAHKLA